jgi:hypothetical protein
MQKQNSSPSPNTIALILTVFFVILLSLVLIAPMVLITYVSSRQTGLPLWFWTILSFTAVLSEFRFYRTFMKNVIKMGKEGKGNGKVLPGSLDQVVFGLLGGALSSLISYTLVVAPVSFMAWLSLLLATSINDCAGFPVWKSLLIAAAGVAVVWDVQMLKARIKTQS